MKEVIETGTDIFDEIKKLKRRRMQLYWPTITRMPIYRM